MKTQNITNRIDSEIKKEADILFKDLGITFSSAVNMFIRQAIREQRIPFQISKNSNIQFAEDKTLEDIAEKEITEHLEAYKDLAK